jgi:hypothetical protein
VSWARETTHTASKQHRCEECVTAIKTGSRFVRWAGVTDGDFSTYKAHAECRDAVIELNRAHGTHWDEWIGLRDLEADDFDWLCEEHQVVAARLGVSMFDWREPKIGTSAFFGRGSHYVWQTPSLCWPERIAQASALGREGTDD